MNYGFFRVAAASLKLKVANPNYNKEEIKKAIDKAVSEDVRLLVTPELSITGYTCADLFFTKSLQDAAGEALKEIVAYTNGKNIAVVLGMPVAFYNSLYNCAVVVLFQKHILQITMNFMKKDGLLPASNLKTVKLYPFTDMKQKSAVGFLIWAMVLFLELSFVKICGCQTLQAVNLYSMEQISL